jgi:hypothetical protein
MDPHGDRTNLIECYIEHFVQSEHSLVPRGGKHRARTSSSEVVINDTGVTSPPPLRDRATAHPPLPLLFSLSFFILQRFNVFPLNFFSLQLTPLRLQNDRTLLPCFPLLFTMSMGSDSN